MWSVILFFICLVIIPLIWILLSSFKTTGEFFSNPVGLPRTWSFKNYIYAFTHVPLMRYLANSVIVAFLSTFIAIVTTVLAAYVFLFQFPYKNWFYIFFMFGLFVPLSAFMLPYYLIVNWLGLYDTLWGLSLVYAGISTPLSFMIIHTYIQEIVTKEVIESAHIDGASFYEVFRWIVLPLSKGGLITASIFLLITAWNELLYALLLTQSMSSKTIQVAIRFFVSTFTANYPLAFAGIIISILPMIIIYTFFNRKIVSGLTMINK